jgi:hypothetical protein
MTWSAPMTAVSNTAFTAAQFNQFVRDNMLESPAAKFTAGSQMFVSTAANAGAVRVPTSNTITTIETVTNTAYVDMATVGPTVGPINTGTVALVIVGADFINNAASATYATFAISGATTFAAGDTNSAGNDGVNRLRASKVSLFTALTAGANTFQMKYRVTGGTGSIGFRHLAVLPF